MRVCLFTDTIADVNGVSRFIRSVAHLASQAGRDLTVLTSTRLPVADAGNIVNLRPLAARALPRYEDLEIALPPARALLRAARALRPDAVHISTPGPVGAVGVWAARSLRVPILGVYHTDFPAYVDHLFGDSFLTGLASRYMRLFYRRFATIFTRSDEYADALAAVGIERGRVVPLRPGIDTDQFQPAMRDESIWPGLGVPRDGLKALYVGRVSVEKNLPLLVEAWRRGGAGSAGARLVVVGDGPYRAEMERRLAGRGAHFLGFREGRELSAIYASADLFVFPSATDTLGQVVMEAQSAGLAALVSDRGGPRGVVADGVSGMVLPAADARAWGGAIGRLLADGERRAAMGRAGHLAMRGMSIRRSFEHFWSVHEGAVAQCNRPPTAGAC